MQQQATFTAFDFTRHWDIDEGYDYPVLRDVSVYALPVALTLADLEGEGTAASPYIVRNADELNAMRLDRSAHYRLGNDIDLSVTISWNLGRGWEPVGTSATRFTGELDGAGFAISNLVFSRSDSSEQSLLGYVEGPVVRDLSIESASVRGGVYTAILASRTMNSSVENAHVFGEVVGGKLSSIDSPREDSRTGHGVWSRNTQKKKVALRGSSRAGLWPVLFRHVTDLTGKDYVSQQAWRSATISSCPLHVEGGCGFKRNGTYGRKFPDGMRIQRYYCPSGQTTFSLIPDFLAAHTPGSLVDIEAAVAEVEIRIEQGASIESTAGDLRPETDLPGAVRWTRRRIQWASCLISRTTETAH